MSFQQTLYGSISGPYVTASYKRVGCVWVTSVRVRASGGAYVGVFDEPIPTINVCGYNSSGSVFSFWQLDPSDGSTVFGPINSTISGIHISADTLYTADPSGKLWIFGLWVQTDMLGAHTVANFTSNPNGGIFPNSFDAINGSQILYANYTAGGTLGTVEDFGVDRNSNLLWLRGASYNAGKVCCFNYTTGALIATLYAPHATKGIVPTGDGFVFIIDNYQWVHLYDYAGAYWGSARNPAGYTGAYGWDPIYKRLLVLNSGTVTAFRFSPNAVKLTTPIPRQVPRKNQITYFFLNVCGDGGEGVSARMCALTNEGAAIGSKLSDEDGDIIERIVPADTANQDVTAAIMGRTYILSLSDAVTLPQATIYVGSTDDFASTGTFVIMTEDQIESTVTYTGKSYNSFTGCTGGTRTIYAGQEVVG